ncbi:galactokinase [Sphingomonas sp. ID1715]|uniref:galactokinase n=1 Tax=Sphingomonas sp. ID1715 TaxID=1656898 RepID=UPI001488842D|nr:galactokinase [Sphingomonas sp. ID1715]NNM75902.1 galactokinase [Sphingomonas sp. ID1715]
MAEQATIERVKRAFAERFGGEPDLIAQAPGRVNLIGEHTDYNDGFVLPLAIDRGTVVAARRAGADVRVYAADFDQEDRFTFAEPVEGSDWRNYVRGIIAMLVEEEIAPQGMELVIAGDVPQGAGLSSSASLEVAVGLAVAKLAGVEIDMTRLAQLAQRAENEFAGCACGIMDQLVSARAEAEQALLIDCRTLECRPVPMPDDLAVLIVHSGVERGLVDSAYNERRQQCEAAARHFGLAALRDAEAEHLETADGLDALARRRARHVVTENARTVQAAEALSGGDTARLSTLMADSHLSMRDDFEITVPAIDELVALLQREIGEEGGARMTGGGFGGCVIALLPRSRVDQVAQAVRDGYRPPNGKPVLIHVCRPAAGAGLLSA